MRTVSSFRVGMTGRGNDALVSFVTLLQARLDAAGSDEKAHPFLPHLGEIIAAQERGDWLKIADLLEFELLPLL
jgi:hypothetical protein